MERKLQERMVGAGILVLALVLFGPLVLDGRDDEPQAGDVPGQRTEEVRSHTFRMAAPSAAEGARTVPVPPVPDAEVAPVPKPGPDVGAAPTPAPRTPAGPQVAATERASPAAEAVAAAPRAPEQRPEVAQRPDAGGNWLVQVGTFGQKQNADRLVTSLRSKGFDAFLSETTRAGKKLYRVRVGPAGTRAAADGLAGKLAAAGQPGQVVSR
jgi:DedD protein